MKTVVIVFLLSALLGCSGDFSYQVYRNESKTFSFRYPKNWIVGSKSGPFSPLVVYVPLKEDGESVEASAVLTSMHLQFDRDESEYSNFMIQGTKKIDDRLRIESSTSSNFELKTNYFTRGFHNQKLIYIKEYQVDQNRDRKYFKTGSIQLGQFNYVITCFCQASNISKYENIFGNIIKSSDF